MAPAESMEIDLVSRFVLTNSHLVSSICDSQIAVPSHSICSVVIFSSGEAGDYGDEFLDSNINPLSFSLVQSGDPPLRQEVGYRQLSNSIGDLGESSGGQQEYDPSELQI